MKYRKRMDGSLATKSQLIAEHPNTSLPKAWTAATLDFLGVDPVLPGTKPVAGPYEYVEELPPVLSDGIWTMTYNVVSTFVEHTDGDGNVVTLADQLALDAAEVAAQVLTEKRVGMVITMRQCRLALLAAGKLAAVDAAIGTLPEPDKTAAATEWEYAHEVHRSSPFVALLGAAIGYTDVEVDALFEQAVTL